MSTEQRSTPRYDVDLPGELGVGHSPETIDMILDNLSIGGCFITTDRPEPPGSILELRFVLPGVTGLKVSAKGRVCWIKNNEGGQPIGMGIQFVSLAAGELEQLKRYLAGFLSSDTP